MNSNALRPWRPSGFGITISDRYKYIYFDNNEYLYDLKSDQLEQNNLISEKEDRFSDLYKDIKSFINARTNAKAAYEERFPDVIEYDAYFEYSVLGKDMPTVVGVVDDKSSSLRSKGEKGALAFGPYLILGQGYYEFVTRYSLSGVSDQQSSSKYTLGYLKDKKWFTLKTGPYKPSVNKKSSVFVHISEDLVREKIELVSDFDGTGSLEIHSLDIFKVAGNAPH